MFSWLTQAWMFMLLTLQIRRNSGCLSGGLHDQLVAKSFLERIEIGNYPGAGAPVLIADTLSCGFTPGEVCSWFNVPTPLDELDWGRAKFRQRVAVSDVERFTGKADIPDDWFLISGSPTPVPARDRAILRSSDVPCQQGNAQLTLRTWHSAQPPNLRFCYMRVGLSDKICRQIDRLSPNPVTLHVPESRDPFFMTIESDGFTTPSTIFIDDIQYNGRLCDDTITPSPTPTQTPTPCAPFVDCNFNSGTPCFWDPLGTGHLNGQWNIGAGKTGNPLTGIKYQNPSDPTPEGFLFVGRDADVPPGAVYVLESPRLHTDRHTSLSFDYFLRSVGPTIQVCVDNFTNCIFTSRRITPHQKWLSETVQIPKGTTRIFFVAKNLRSNLYAAIDNIQMNDQNILCI